MKKEQLLKGGNPLITIAVLSVLCVSAYLFWTNIRSAESKKDELAKYEAEYESRRIENDAKEDQVNRPVDDEYIKDLAEDELHLFDNDAQLFYFNDEP
ncbi:hypothetical protein FACS1894219_02660 [Clostridia bacterium]|nr:hypothetical protein FACS1894219_02660 [Clostridia bacterium]